MLRQNRRAPGPWAFRERSPPFGDACGASRCAASSEAPSRRGASRTSRCGPSGEAGRAESARVTPAKHAHPGKQPRAVVTWATVVAVGVRTVTGPLIRQRRPHRDPLRAFQRELRTTLRARVPLSRSPAGLPLLMRRNLRHAPERWTPRTGDEPGPRAFAVPGLEPPILFASGTDARVRLGPGHAEFGAPGGLIDFGFATPDFDPSSEVTVTVWARCDSLVPGAVLVSRMMGASIIPRGPSKSLEHGCDPRAGQAASDFGWSAGEARAAANASPMWLCRSDRLQNSSQRPLSSSIRNCKTACEESSSQRAPGSFGRC